MILKTLISFFRCVWLGLELNSAGHRPSRTEVAYPCTRGRWAPGWWGCLRLIRADPSTLQVRLGVFCSGPSGAGLLLPSRFQLKLSSNHTCLKKTYKVQLPTRKPREKAHLEFPAFIVTVQGSHQHWSLWGYKNISYINLRLFIFSDSFNSLDTKIIYYNYNLHYKFIPYNRKICK